MEQGWNGDEVTWRYNLPFAFPYYGKTYTNLYVSSNGTLSFGNKINNSSYSATTFKQEPMIAVLWKDLVTTKVYMMRNGSSVTIRWYGEYWSDRNPVNFSATLDADGEIRLSYGAGNATGGYVGVSAGDGVNWQLVGNANASWANAQDVVLRNGLYVPTTANLPSGLSFDASGRLYGTPDEGGAVRLAFRATDADGNTATTELPFTVLSNPNERPVVDSEGSDGRRCR